VRVCIVVDCAQADMPRVVTQPALMLTADKDVVLTPELTKDMEKWVPKLTRARVRNAGHWVQTEQPDEVNQALGDWLATALPQHSRL